ncbi:type II secretion system protein GspL [Croceicoccus mobilis]|uniref:Type II secretion system protein GspL n=1 Tax=Croceicoccus mobilis TaxID=1703339 RepID=A0A917DU69_9SPHN|nr:type II secretion system protein GspL [Croceicoccus mobilis]GGD69245.1 type II secretion system protein GspL [Croceicoccus mobilis]
MARFTQPLPERDASAPDVGGVIVLLGEHPRDDWRWWRVGADGLHSEHGFTPGDDAAWGDAGRVVAMVPSVLAPVRFSPRGDMSGPQAIAAARLAPKGAGATEETHVAAALLADGDTIASCTVAKSDMDVWLAELAAAGLDPQAVIPAAMALPEPPDGELLSGTLGSQVLARSAQAAFAGEPDMIAALSGDARRREAGADALADALFTAWADPPLDLRQGVYAPPRVSFFRLPDWAQLARMAAVLALLGFLILAVETVKLEWDANAQEEAALAAARERFPAVTDLASAESQINAELLRRGAGGASFDAVTPAVFAAMQPHPSVQLRSLSWQRDGTLAIRAAAPRTEDLNAMLIALQADGWVITVPPSIAPDATGATVADITVRAP